MEELINKSDEQFENYLVKITDYNEDASKRDPLIKQLASTKNHKQPQTPTNNKSIKPAASLNSSIYSSAASSTSSSSASSTSSATSDSSTASSSSTHSAASSASSSPSQTQAKQQEQQLNNHIANDTNCVDNDTGRLEMIRLEDLGRTAKIFEHHQVPSIKSSAASGKLDLKATQYADKNLSDSSADKASPQLTTSSSTSTDSVELDNIKKSILLTPVPCTAQRYAAINLHNLKQVASMTSNASSDISWKTIGGRRDKRRKKPAEKIVLTEHIPGHRGDTKVAVDDLVNYIESNGTSNKSKNKTQHSSKISTNSSGQKNQQNNPSNTNQQINNTTNNINGGASSLDYPKRSHNNVSLSVNVKTQQPPSKVNITNQPKNPPQRNQPPPMSQNHMQKPQAALTNSQDTQSELPQKQPQKSLIKPSPQPIIQQQPQLRKQPQRQPQQQKQQPKPQAQQPLQQQPQLSKPMNAKPTQQPSYQRLAPQVTHKQNQNQSQSEHPQDRKPSTGLLNKASLGKTNDDKQAVVVFADHIPVGNEELSHYTFGFFNEQPKQIPSGPKDDNKTSNITDSRRQLSYQNPPDGSKQKVKRSKASPNLEETRTKVKPSADPSSFNYEQILKFISDGWTRVCDSQKH